MTSPAAFDLDGYLERVGLDGPVGRSPEGLEALHRAQAYSIPFENFDILLGRKLDLSPGGLFRKLVSDRRGGYCFELNGLLLEALRHLGFETRPLLARVHLGPEPSGPHHQVSLVTIGDGEWLADVGFGAEGPRAPVRFVLDEPQAQDGRVFRLVARPPFGTMLQLRRGDAWADQYSVDLGHVCPADIETGNHYTETHPGSFFTWARTASRPSPNGRTALRNFRLHVISGDEEHTVEVGPGAAYLRTLDEHFGIDLKTSYEMIRPVSADEIARFDAMLGQPPGAVTS